MSHIAAAGKVRAEGENRLTITEWFCPTTVANLSKNPKVCLVVYNQAYDRGFQLIGEVQNMQDVSIMNGYSSQHTFEPPLPQVERKLTILIGKVFDFGLGPHSDVETPQMQEVT